MSYNRMFVYVTLRIPGRSNSFPGHGICIGKTQLDRAKLVRALKDDNMGSYVTTGKRGILYYPNQYDANLIYDVDQVINRHEYLDLNETYCDNEGLGTEDTHYIIVTPDPRLEII